MTNDPCPVQRRARIARIRRDHWSLDIGPWSFRARHTPRARRGSVIVIVMVTLLFATFALVAFMEKASVDLLVEQRESVNRRLRIEAYNALETTLAVLEDFREVGQGLRSPAEGWGNPLEFAGYTPADGVEVQVTFVDESGKISLPHANLNVLVTLFENWGVPKADAEPLADALLGWMKRDHVYMTAIQPTYDMGPLPFEPPRRSLRSYHELAAIERAREFFYDEEGRPNEYWKRFTESVSLLDFRQSNLNGARPDTLAALGRFDEQQQQNLADYLRGAGNFQNSGPGFFQSANDAQRIAGPAGDVSAFGATISALRIIVTVRDGRTEFRLSTVVAPQGSSAKTVQENATTNRLETSAGASRTAKQQQSNQPNAQQSGKQPPIAGKNPSGGAVANLKYPFTLLEMRENDAIPPVPPAPTDPSLL